MQMINKCEQVHLAEIHRDVASVAVIIMSPNAAILLVNAVLALNADALQVFCTHS